ncbi:hypothetical protein P7K49_013921 [Saguinus oedipus]|uniref:Uncharacterized protein n=1 Tax=Saguinus oedipus TaxID=9490 RepID=A0ABQ9VHV8_SAGOE|nr:hypothetical protein P7K49_013921 [Saguinus oedipus]
MTLKARKLARLGRTCLPAPLRQSPRWGRRGPQDQSHEPFPGAATAHHLRQPRAPPGAKRGAGGAERPQPRRLGYRAGALPRMQLEGWLPAPRPRLPTLPALGPRLPVHADLKVPLSSRSSGGASARCLLWDMARKDGSAAGGRAVRSNVLAPRVPRRSSSAAASSSSPCSCLRSSGESVGGAGAEPWCRSSGYAPSLPSSEPRSRPRPAPVPSKALGASLRPPLPALASPQ